MAAECFFLEFSINKPKLKVQHSRENLLYVARKKPTNNLSPEMRERRTGYHQRSKNIILKYTRGALKAQFLLICSKTKCQNAVVHNLTLIFY